MRKKRRLAIVLVVIFVAVVGAILWLNLRSASAAIGHLSIYDGSAEVVGQQTTPAQTGDPVLMDETIRVAEGSKVAIVLNDGSLIRLSPGTEIKIADIAYAGNNLQTATFDVENGNGWSHVSPLAPGATYNVETPTVVATVRGTNFNVTYDGTETEVYVGSHAVWVALRSDPGNTQAVAAGQIFIIRDAKASSDFAMGPKEATSTNDWFAYNESQDFTIEPDVSIDATSSSSKQPTPETSPAKITHPAVPTSTPVTVATTTKNSAPSLLLTAETTTTSQNQTVKLSVLATYADGSTKNVTSQVSWIESPALNIIDSQGNFHATFTGQTSISAKLSGVTSNNIGIFVNTAEKPQTVLTSIALSYQKSSPVGVMYAGLPTVQFTATGDYSDGSTSDITARVSWTNDGQAGGSVDANGNYIPQTEGQETITATLGSISNATTVSIP